MDKRPAKLGKRALKARQDLSAKRAREGKTVENAENAEIANNEVVPNDNGRNDMQTDGAGYFTRKKNEFAELKKERDQLQMRNSEVEKTNEKMLSEKKALDEKIATLEKENHEKDLVIVQLKEAHDRIQNDSSLSKLVTLRKLNDDLRNECRIIKDACVRVEVEKNDMEKMIAEIEAECDKLKGENDQWEREHEKLKNACDEILNESAALRQELNDLSVENDGLKEKVEGSEKRNEFLTSACSIANKQNDELLSITPKRNKGPAFIKAALSALREDTPKFPLTEKIDLKSPLDIGKVLPEENWAPFSKLARKSKEKPKRAESLNAAAKAIASESDPSEFLKYFEKYNAKKQYKWANKMSLMEALELKSRLHLSIGKVANLKKSLSEFTNGDPFPSIEQLRNYEKSITEEDFYDIDVQKGKTSSRPPKLRIILKAVEPALKARMQNRYNSGLIDNSDEPEKITILGDKGKGTTKLGLAFASGSNTNSPDNLMKMAWYTGDDSQKSIVECMSGLLDELTSLKSIFLKDSDGKLFEKKLEFQLTGDVKFLCEVFGHKGASATHPCFQCYHPKDGNNGRMRLEEWDHKKDYQQRTADEYRRYSRYIDGFRGVKEGETILFPFVPLENVIPPSLHIIMGIFDKYIFEKLIVLAMKFDSHTQAEIEVVTKSMEKDSALTKLEEELYNLRMHLEYVERDEENLRIALRTSDRVDNNHYHRPQTEHYCRARYCIVAEMQSQGYAEPFHTTDCSKCGEMKHLVCAGVYTTFDRAEIEHAGKELVCFMCQKLNTPEQIIPGVKQSLTEYGMLRAMSSTQIENVERSIEQLNFPKQGPCRQAFEKVIYGDLKLVRKSYHGGKFTGNAIQYMLNPARIDQIMNVFEPTEEVGKMRTLMHHLGKIMSFATAKLLSDLDIEMLATNIDDFIVTLKETFPKETITPKLHLLAKHVVPYVRKFGSWGLTSEQLIEHLHCVIAGLEHEYFPIRDLVLRYKTIIRQRMIRNFIHDTTVS